MIRALLCASLLAAREGQAAPDTPKPTSTVTRPTTPRSRLPEVIRPLVPRRGIYAAGGGLVSRAWRIVVDYEASTHYTGSVDRANAPSFGPMEKEATRPLDPEDEAQLARLADEAWSEPAPDGPPPRPSADYDEILVVADGDDTFLLHGYGPIGRLDRPAASKLIEALRALGARLASGE